MSKPIFVMLDTETTSLDTRRGLPWEIGLIAFDSRYKKILEWSSKSPIPVNSWDADTLEFARNSMGYTFVEEYAVTHDRSALGTVAAWNNYAQMIAECMNVLTMLAAGDNKNLYLICNHVEFDWSMLLNAQEKAGITKNSFEKIIYYRNKLDLQSLCRGSACARGHNYNAMYGDYKAYMASCGKDKVAHRAIADCEHQIGMLRFFFDDLDSFMDIGQTTCLTRTIIKPELH